MTHLIDKDIVVAEIEKRIADNKKDIERASHKNLEDYFEGYEDALALFKQQFLDTLEVKEVDLEKEIERFTMSKELYEADSVIKSVAEHFFELGLKVKQEFNDEVKIGETQIYLEDDGGEPPYDGKQWLDLSCTEYKIPKTIFKDGDNVEILIRKARKGE